MNSLTQYLIYYVRPEEGKAMTLYRRVIELDCNTVPNDFLEYYKQHESFWKTMAEHTLPVIHEAIIVKVEEL